MADEKPNKYVREESVPIPTYDEATSSHPLASQSFLGPTEVSHDAERQGLLGRRPPAPSGTYRPPEVESARSSLDDLLPSSGDSSARSSVEALQSEMLQMDVEEPSSDGPQSQMGIRISKRISSITNGLSSLNLPFRQWLPSFEYVRAHIPQFPSQIPEAFKPGWIMVFRFFALVFVLLMAYIVFLSGLFSFRQRRGMGAMYDPESVRLFVQQNVNETAIRGHLEHLTSFDHIAGTEGSYVLAKYVEAVFHAAKLDRTDLERFDVYLNYPTKAGRRVAVIDPPEKVWEAKIEEEMAYTDPSREQTLVFHGLSKSGNVTGPLIYANYGSRDDFKRLQDNGINLDGAIALVRYYGSQGDRALKVKAAAMAGAIGCIIYSDPSEDGFLKGSPYPNGRYMPADGVQRGTVGLTSWIVGDVLSPGFASLPGESKRISKDENPGLNTIPSLPLAWRDAQKLLQALKGHGEKLNNDNGWVGGVPDVEWWTGDHGSPTVHLRNEQDEVDKQPIYNVLGKIEGVEQGDKSIIVGNHRDAWGFGAVDPGSGTAVFLEVVRIFGDLKKLGWRPMRSIEFMSWDAEEYNLIGSTEHVEQRTEDLRRSGFAYINVDVAVQGDDFHAAGPALFQKSLFHVLGRTSDPYANKTLRQLWNEKGRKLEGLGAGSDYVAFQDIAGTSSIDLCFKGKPFPYHSSYDNFKWMSQFGDPDFQYHKVMGQVWALLILDLADRPVLPFDLEAYAHSVKGYAEDLQTYSDSKNTAASLNMQALNEAADLFVQNAQQFHNWDREWTQNVYGMGGYESQAVTKDRISHNTRMANFETDLLDIDGGLPGREQYKHVLFAPQAWSGYDEAVFPGVRDAIDGDWERAQQQVEKISTILSRASRNLLG
ncbi:hypothetical protein MMC13_002495 [Lambiella insularis]|nr:hypothetical protein [Lambiella insularis]